MLSFKLLANITAFGCVIFYFNVQSSGRKSNTITIHRVVIDKIKLSITISQTFNLNYFNLVIYELIEKKKMQEKKIKKLGKKWNWVAAVIQLDTAVSPPNPVHHRSSPLVTDKWHRLSPQNIRLSGIELRWASTSELAVSLGSVMAGFGGLQNKKTGITFFRRKISKNAWSTFKFYGSDSENKQIEKVNVRGPLNNGRDLRGGVESTPPHAIISFQNPMWNRVKQCLGYEKASKIKKCI